MKTPLARTLAALFMVVFLAGCAQYHYERKLDDGSVEKTSVNAFISTTAVKGYSSSTKDGADGSHSRTVRVKEADNQTEIEKLGPLIEQLGAGVARGAMQGAKGMPPIPGH